MNRGCLVLAGLGLLSLLAFGVTLEAINDTQQLTAIPIRGEVSIEELIRKYKTR